MVERRTGEGGGGHEQGGEVWVIWVKSNNVIIVHIFRHDRSHQLSPFVMNEIRR